MKYRYTYTVQYQDVDATRRIRLHTLENYLLNVAGRVADELGFGIPALLPMGYTWIITRLSLEMLYLPKHGDVLVFETWIEQNVHLLSVRDYTIYIQDAKGDETLLGKAKSVWAILDLDKREMVNIFDLPMFAGKVDGEVLDIAKPRRLLPIRMESSDPEALGVGAMDHTIMYSDVDYNMHCNSCRYLEWMLNSCPWSDGAHPMRLDINYTKELHLGECMHTQYLQKEASIQYQQIDDNGHACCTAQISHIDSLSC